MDPYKQPYINPNVPPSVPGNATNFSSSPGFYGNTVSPSFTQTGDYSSTYPRFAIPVYGASYSPAFGTPSSYFGGPSFSGQKSGGFWQPQPEPSTNRCGSTAPFSATSIPATGRTSTPTFGITNTQSSGFRQPQPALSTNLPQPALSTNLYGSTAPFAATGTPATGPTSTQTFGVTNTHSFGSTNTPAFDATSTSAFRSTTAPTFGGTGTTFGVSSIPVSSSSTVPASGSSCTAPYVPFYPPKPIPAFVGPFAPFSSFLYPVYSNQSIPAFGSMQVGTNVSPGDGIYPFESSASGQKPAFGVSGSSPSQISPCGFQQAQSAFHGANTTNSSLGLSDDQSAFDDQSCGTSATLYTSTAESDSQYPGELESDHTLPENKCQEELRWEHCQLRNEGSEGTKTSCVQEMQANIIKSQDDLVVALKEKIADLEDELHDLRNCPPMISNSCNEQHLEKEVWESKLKLDAMTRERNLLSEMLAFFQQIVTVMSSRTTMMSSVGQVPSEGCCNSILTSLLEKKAPEHLSSAKQGCDKVKQEDYDLQARLVESMELLALVEQERDDAVKEACDLRCQLLKLSQGAKGIKCSNEKTNRGGGYLNKEEMNISTDEQGPLDLNWKTCKGNSNINFKEITHKGVYSHGGQVTDNLFLAEKVRRYEISRRMKYLQDLVPGCNKISDKVKMLDEVINYVQSLQSQPESLHSNTTFSTQLHQPPSLPLPPSVPGADHVGVGVGSTNYLNLGL